jgi:thiamine kinase-like enzyme
VARVSDAGSAVLAIDRRREHANTVAASETGVSPAVAEYLAGRGLLVVEWIEGSTLDETGVGANLARIARSCRQLHSGRPFEGRFDMFEIQASYLAAVQEEGYLLPERYLDYLPAVEQIREAFAASPEPLVPCNNDLLAANFIDDGQQIWIIDFEYSGNNEPSFELGNIWSESTLSDEALEELVGAYWGEAAPAKVARARLWGLMSKYGWTLWASIQRSISPIDFDYWAWGMEKYERAEAEFRSPDFANLLRQAVSRR